MLPQMEDSADEDADRTKVGPSATSLANHFISDTVLLVFELQGAPSTRVQLCRCGAPDIQASLSNKNLNIPEAERGGLRRRIIGIFPRAQ